MYGVNSSYNSGDTIYELSNSSTNTYWTCVYDSGGTNTIDASQTTTNNTINIGKSSLNDNAQYAGVTFTYNSFGGITFANNNTNMHNVINSSNNDTIVGNTLNNNFTLTNGGNDTVNGRQGYDIAYLTNISFSNVTYVVNPLTGVRTITNNQTNESIRLVNVEEIVFSDKTVLTYSNILESGSINVTHKPKTIRLKRTFKNPIVICGDPSFNDKDHCVVRILKITRNSFTIKLQEEGNKTNKKHKFEKIAWIVGERGRWSISNSNIQIIFGNFNTNKTTRNGFKKITFSNRFTTRPIVLSQVASNRGKSLVTTRMKNVRNTSFQCCMQESDGLNNKHGTENIHWCAITPGIFSIADLKVQTGILNRINNKIKSFRYRRNYFSTVPILLSKCCSYKGKDLVITRYKQIGMQFKIKLQEDKTEDNETKHGDEIVNFIAIG